MLPIPINPRGDESEPIELRACRLVAGSEIFLHRSTVERHGDSPVAVGSRRVVFQCPIVRGAIGVNARRTRSRTVARAIAAVAIDRVEKKSFAGWALDGGAQKILGCAELLGGIHLQALRGMIEPDESRAVADASAQADLARSTQWAFQCQRAEPVAVRRQAVAVPAIAAEEQATQLSCCLAAGVVRGSESKIEPGTDVASLVRALVA